MLLAQGGLTVYYEDILNSKFNKPAFLPIPKNDHDLPFGITMIGSVVWLGYQNKLVVGYER